MAVKIMTPYGAFMSVATLYGSGIVHVCVQSPLLNIINWWIEMYL